MPLLPQTNRAINPNVVDGLLKESGFVEPIDPEAAKTEASQILRKKGASLDSVLGNLVDLMHMAETESVKLGATRDCLAIHGVSTKPAEKTNNMQINLVFNNVQDGPKRLDAILCPVR